MRTLLVISALAVVALTGCTRPAAVREVAAQSKVLLNKAHVSGEALREQFKAQRFDLARSAASYDAIRRDTAQAVSLAEALWRDEKRLDLIEQLRAQQVLDGRVREDAFSPDLVPVQQAITVPDPAPIDIAGLLKAAQALDRMQKERSISAQGFLGFAKSVSDELKKLQDEKDPS